MTINGTEIDFSKQRGYFFNMDCMDALKQMPDKSVSLAIVDPPYGAGFTEGGGCQGWFSKYHQDESSQICQVERERERRRSRGTDSAADLTDTRIWKTSDKTRRGGNFDKYKEIQPKKS